MAVNLSTAQSVEPGGPLDEVASRGVTARDPSTIVKDGDRFWTFYTGRGVHSLSSTDLVEWKPGPKVFEEPPAWIAETVPKNKGTYWAPDVIQVVDRFFLFYSVSSFGKMDSAIGLATTPTLNPDEPDFGWTDQGPVVQSSEGGDFNAIDPAAFLDDDGKLWLAFGSQWSGLKLIELDPETGQRLHPDEPLIALSSSPSMEAAYIYKRDGLYYLFQNRGTCCRGDESTYHIQMGRSKTITGPYLTRSGRQLLEGAGTPVMDVKLGPLTGPGHAGIIEKDGKSWFSCHFEADDRMNGEATLAVMPITWTEDGWPEVSPQEEQ
jgi:arabinan endo-1,5-alpha-L-arabinosidase